MQADVNVRAPWWLRALRCCGHHSGRTRGPPLRLKAPDRPHLRTRWKRSLLIAPVAADQEDVELVDYAVVIAVGNGQVVAVTLAGAVAGAHDFDVGLGNVAVSGVVTLREHLRRGQ